MPPLDIGIDDCTIYSKFLFDQHDSLKLAMIGNSIFVFILLMGRGTHLHIV